MRAWPGVRSGRQGRRGGAGLRGVLDLRPVRPAAQVLSGRQSRHRPLRDRAGAAPAGGEGHLHHHDLQGVLIRPAMRRLLLATLFLAAPALADPAADEALWASAQAALKAGDAATARKDLDTLAQRGLVKAQCALGRLYIVGT